MSLITRCPACATMFSVVPDQLRVSDGWVRCGQCDEVFDANAHLQTDLMEAGAAEGTPGEGGAPNAPLEASVAPPVSAEASAAVPLAEHDHVPAPTDPFLEKSPHELSRLEGVGDQDHLDHDVAPCQTALREDALHPQAGPRYVQSDVFARPVDSDSDYSFLRIAPARSAWHRPLVRGALAMLCVLLVSILVLQVSVEERDRIVAAQPGSKDLMESLCQVLGCRIRPLRQIESIVIDSSSFAKVRADVYRLNFTLRNTSEIAVATPALELTLTDFQDQTVVRRVLSTDELGVRQVALPAGSDLNASVPVGVKATGNLDRISGYRLLAFYP